jgi:hypothetical protein
MVKQNVFMFLLLKRPNTSVYFSDCHFLRKLYILTRVTIPERGRGGMGCYPLVHFLCMIHKIITKCTLFYHAGKIRSQHLLTCAF